MQGRTKRAFAASVSLLVACNNSPSPEAGGSQAADETTARYEMFHDRIDADGVHPPGDGGERLGKGEYAICTYDAARDRTVLFTGRRDEAGEEPATWSWNGNSWTAHGGAQPRAAARFALGFDEARGVTVLYGGRSTQDQLLHEVWEFDGETWKEIATRDSYPAEEGGHFAYDRPSGALVYMSTGEHPWTWDGTEWRESEHSVGSYARKITSSTTDADGHALFLERELGVRVRYDSFRDVPHLLRYSANALRREEAPSTDHVYLDTTRDALTFAGIWYESNGQFMGPTYADYACVSFDTSRERLVKWSPESPDQVTEVTQMLRRAGDGVMLRPYSWSRRVGQPLYAGFPYQTDGTDGLSDRYESDDLPAGFHLVESGVYASRFDWTPTADQIGRHEFTVTVTSRSRSGTVWTDSQKYVIDVLEN